MPSLWLLKTAVTKYYPIVIFLQKLNYTRIICPEIFLSNIKCHNIFTSQIHELYDLADK